MEMIKESIYDKRGPRDLSCHVLEGHGENKNGGGKARIKQARCFVCAKDRQKMLAKCWGRDTQEFQRQRELA
jgi:hypothetical protein